MQIGELAADLRPHARRMAAARDATTEPVDWYLYGILGNLIHIDRLLPEPYRDLAELAGGLPIADIGAADGDLGFTLEHAVGCEVDIIDTASTNHNGLRAATVLKAQLGSNAGIHDINLDEQFRLPRERYGLVLLLGILYHLQNPFFVLNQLSKQARFCLVSTRVARFAGSDGIDISKLPVAYLVGAREMNDDPTNYWVFSDAGLAQLVERTGWIVRATMNVGDISASRRTPTTTMSGRSCCSNPHGRRPSRVITGRPQSDSHRGIDYTRAG